MQPSNNMGIDLEEKLAAIDRQLQDIRHDVADILYHVQDELSAIREREFWREYRESQRDE